MTRRITVRRSAILCAIFFLTTLAASTAGADDPRYEFLDAGWVFDDPDEGDSENGWFGGGSFGTRRFHFFGEYRDPGRFEIWEVGGGWHGLLGRSADLIAEAAYVDADFDEGYRASGGIRWMIADDFEINGYYNHIDIGDFENDGFSLGAHREFGRHFAVGGQYEFGDEADTARIFGRLYFRKDT